MIDQSQRLGRRAGCVDLAAIAQDESMPPMFCASVAAAARKIVTLRLERALAAGLVSLAEMAH
jgi:hypothetical protein